MRPRLKVVFRWVLALIGFFVGLCALAKFGMWWAPLGDRDQGWVPRWLTFVGIGLLGVGFLVGSLFAPRNPRRAGVIFLVFLPITAFCLAYPESGFLALLTLRHRKRAALVS